MELQSTTLVLFIEVKKYLKIWRSNYSIQNSSWQGKQARPKIRWRDYIKEDLAEVGVREEDTADRRRWKQKIRTGDAT